VGGQRLHGDRGRGFALAFAAYFFLMAQERQWPASAPPPDLLWGA
jgi:hypothetical protein